MRLTRTLYDWIESLRSNHGPASEFNRGISSGTMKIIEDIHPSHENYDFRVPVNADRSEIESDFLAQIAETRAFRRLLDIRFLGALDYYMVSSPNGLPQNSRYTRAQHSWGVAMLAQRYLRGKNFTQKERLTCLAAAMLHDIGHSAFSHTIEPAFIDLFGINHHAVSEGIIRGLDPDFEDVSATLLNFDVDPEQVISVLNGNDAIFDRYFSGPINFDTIEGILRSRHYIRMETLGLSPWRVLNASLKRSNSRDQETVDNFWLMKGDIYNLVIRSTFGSFLDQIFLELFKTQRDKISPNDFYLTESQMFRKFPILRKAFDEAFVEKFSKETFATDLNVVVRRFHVDESQDFFARFDSARYLQTKERRSVPLPS